MTPAVWVDGAVVDGCAVTGAAVAGAGVDGAAGVVGAGVVGGVKPYQHIVIDPTGHACQDPVQ